jgi:DNA-binding NarL/FixJ family response regulator
MFVAWSGTDDAVPLKRRYAAMASERKQAVRTDPEVNLSRITVAAVSEDLLMSRRVGASLQGNGFKVIATARTPDELVEICGGQVPNVGLLIWDRFEPEHEAWFRLLGRELPGVRLIGVAVNADSSAVRASIGAGAQGFLLESHLEDGLVWAIRAVCSGLLCLPQEFARYVAKPILSVREKQILGMVVLGLTNGEIAQKLYLAESTVKSHLTSAFGKLGVRSRNEATNLILDANNGLGPGILAIVDDQGLGPTHWALAGTSPPSTIQSPFESVGTRR